MWSVELKLASVVDVRRVAGRLLLKRVCSGKKWKKMMQIVKRWEGGFEYYFLVVEFQHRGLPHCHLALRCKDSCDLRKANEALDPQSTTATDSKLASWRPHIQTEMPRDVFKEEPPQRDAEPLKERASNTYLNSRYRQLVCEHMLHHLIPN